MTTLFASILHPGIHAHPHQEGLVASLISSPWAALAIGGAVVLGGYMLLQRRQRN